VVEDALGPDEAGVERKREQLDSREADKRRTMRGRNEKGVFCICIIPRYGIADRAQACGDAAHLNASRAGCQTGFLEFLGLGLPEVITSR